MFSFGKLDISDTSLASRRPRRPPPSYRNAAPSGPWPWMDLDSDIDDAELSPVTPFHRGSLNWDYPSNLFPNWTPQRVDRSGIKQALMERYDTPCTIYNVDVLDSGNFKRSGEHVITEENKAELKEILQTERPPGIRMRAVFAENIHGHAIQIFGTFYNIEPFFFSSSLNKIPSRYQEDVQPNKGDHITITLTFLRSMIDPASSSFSGSHSMSPPLQVDKVLDPSAHLSLRSNGRILMLDQMAIHMIRLPTSSTILSFHCEADWRSTTAKEMHKLVRLAGQSVYWRKIFEKSSDPTFVLLAILWHAIYSWDEALSSLYTHVQSLEKQAIRTNESVLTQELHVIRAHLLNHTSLLEDFRKSVQFIKDTPNPAMNAESKAPEKETSRELLIKECDMLLSEIERLEMSRDMQNKRVKNVMDLVFATVNIVDSQHAKALTETATRDSRAMKQIAYLTMVFLPASFSASVFGMNITELNQGSFPSYSRYLELAIPLTAVTIWIIIALQSKTHLGDPDPSMWPHIWWPFTSLVNLWTRIFRARGAAKNHARV